MNNPFNVSDTLNPSDFKLYNHVDCGVVVLKKDKRATIAYVNDAFAEMLGTTKNLLVNRSLDSITVNKQPHYRATARFARTGTKIGRKMKGGRSVDAIIQEGKRKGRLIPVTVWKMENHRDYLLGYVRKSTRFEQVIENASFNPVVDNLWKPTARFFLSGKRRPFYTSLASVLLPYVLAKHPEILDIIRRLFPVL
ncbi:MAG: PAS domain-containing protein [Cyanobacteria bacterium J06631_12]